MAPEHPNEEEFTLFIDPEEDEEEPLPSVNEALAKIFFVDKTQGKHQQAVRPFMSGALTHTSLLNHKVEELSAGSRINHRPFNRFSHSWGWRVGCALPAAFSGGMIGYLAASGLNYFTSLFNHLLYPNLSAGQDASNYSFIKNFSWASYLLLCLAGMGLGYHLRYEVDEEKYVAAYRDFTSIMQMNLHFEAYGSQELLQELINHSIFLLDAKHGAKALGHLIANIHSTFFPDPNSTHEPPLFEISSEHPTSVDVFSESSDEELGANGESQQPARLLNRKMPRLQTSSIGQPDYAPPEVSTELSHLKNSLRKLKGGGGFDFINSLQTITHNVSQLLARVNKVETTHENREDILRLKAELNELQQALTLDKLHFMSVWVFAIRQHMSHSGVLTPQKERIKFLQAILSDPFYINQDDNTPTLNNPLALGEIMYIFFDYCRATPAQLNVNLNEGNENPANKHFLRERELDRSAFTALDKTHQCLVVDAIQQFTCYLKLEHPHIKDSRIWHDLLKEAQAQKPKPSFFSRKRFSFFSPSSVDHMPPEEQSLLLSDDPDSAANHYGKGV